MKPEFEQYLIDIGQSTTMIDTIKKHYVTLANLASVSEFDDVFLSEGVSDTGIRVSLALFGFTKTLLCQFDIFDGDVVVVRIKNHINFFRIDDHNFDLMNVTKDSKLHCQIRRMDASGLFNFSSFGTNCSQLLMIIKKYFVNNMNY